MTNNDNHDNKTNYVATIAGVEQDQHVRTHTISEAAAHFERTWGSYVVQNVRRAPATSPSGGHFEDREATRREREELGIPKPEVSKALAAAAARGAGDWSKRSASLRSASLKETWKDPLREAAKREGIYTVYPQSWFGSGNGKQHAVQLDEQPVRGKRASAFCGARGEAVETPFRAEENVRTCSRCVKAAKAVIA